MNLEYNEMQLEVAYAMIRVRHGAWQSGAHQHSQRSESLDRERVSA